MENPEVVALIVIALIIGGATAYIVKAKKSGKKCIGCPHGDKCKGSCNSCNCDFRTCNQSQDLTELSDNENNND